MYITIAYSLYFTFKTASAEMYMYKMRYKVSQQNCRKSLTVKLYWLEDNAKENCDASYGLATPRNF